MERTRDHREPWVRVRVRFSQVEKFQLLIENRSRLYRIPKSRNKIKWRKVLQTERAGGSKRLLQGHRSIGRKLPFTRLLIGEIKVSIHTQLTWSIIEFSSFLIPKSNNTQRQRSVSKDLTGLIKCNRISCHQN